MSSVRDLLPPAAHRAAARAVAGLAGRRYARRPVPWTRGYVVHRDAAIRAAIRDPEILQRLRLRSTLPAGYGSGFDERVVELPWSLAQLSDADHAVLDAGSVLNSQHLVEQVLVDGRDMHIATLAPENEAFWRCGISYVYCDLRALPMRACLYDVVLCISTLEHVGFDNSDYLGRHRRPAAGGDEMTAVTELRRVLRPGGRLVLTVPYGRGVVRTRLRQFDRERLENVASAFGPAAISLEFFRSFARGWQRATQQECDDAAFGSWGSRGNSSESCSLPAAEAVACLVMQR